MKTQIAAGGIVLRKRAGHWQVLVLQDMNRAWTFPKGAVEQGEHLLDAAKREIREEVGITDVTKVAALAPIRYTYRRGGTIAKTVHYFLFESNGKETPVAQKEEGIGEIRWLPIGKAMKVIGYAKTNTPLLIQVKQWTLNLRRT